RVTPRLNRPPGPRNYPTAGGSGGRAARSWGLKMGDGTERDVRVGFVGVGDLGREVARRILRAGWPLTVYARREEVRTDFRDAGASIASDLAELGRSSDLVGVCVVDDAQVREVLLGPGVLSGLRHGGLIAIHSTVHPDTCREIAAAAGPQGVAVID